MKKYTKLNSLQAKIKKYSTKFKIPINNTFTKINSDSWFDINISNENNLFNPKLKLHTDKLESDGYYTKKIKLHPTDFQKKILLKWMDCYVLMYNEVNKYFKKCKFEKQKCVFNITELKSMFKNSKNDICKWSIIKHNTTKNCKTITKNIIIDRHLLDYAINDSLNRFKSNLTNLKNRNIKHFRLRYLKMKRKNKILKIEKLAFKKNGFWTASLGKIMKSEINNFNYLSNIHTTAILQYLEKDNQFYLLLKYPKKDLSNDNDHKNKQYTISIDPGIRRMFTGYSNNGILKIGDHCYNKIKRLIKKNDSINNTSAIKNKKHVLKKCNNKIKNLIIDLQWKTIKHLTNNYKTILMGNFSTTNMKNVPKMVKRVGKKYNLFMFKERLKYKCIYTNTSYKKVDEAYTTKCCNSCGHYKKELKGEKIYNCNKCYLSVDRDINGAINILINNCK
jgi:transposase